MRRVARGAGSGPFASTDFRLLFASRITSQVSDGLFQSALVASVVFSPENADTAAGFFRATLIVILPFTVLGPFAGVFIDRWPRRRILELSPPIKSVLAMLALADPHDAAVAFYVGALLVLSVNRFFLSTTQAVLPRLVAGDHLVRANSYVAVGGTVALLAGVFIGGKTVDGLGADNAAMIWVAAAGWLAAAAIARRIRSDLRPHREAPRPDLLRHELRRVVAELGDGVRRLVRTRRAVAPIASIVLDQVGQGLLLTLSLVVFRGQGAGVGTFSDLVGWGGVGVLAGILTVRRLSPTIPKERLVAAMFLVGGLAALMISFRPEGLPLLIGAAVTGFTFAWKKSAVDAMVQESFPDGYRGRVQSVYDICYHLARVAAGALAIAVIEPLGEGGTIALVGIAFLIWSPLLPALVRGIPAFSVRFSEGGRAEEWPSAVIWGGGEEEAEVIRTALVEQDGQRLRTFRLALADGSVVDVAKPEPDGDWRVVREAED